MKRIIYKGYLKRLIDIVLAIIILLVIWPIMLLIAVIIKIDSKGPVVFTQERLTLNGKVFKMMKFRTMCVNAEHIGTGVYSYNNDPRVTRVGRVLRKLSLDELMQLCNILKGDMSFIGPRPILTYHPCTYDLYTEKEKTVFTVRPGITGWAQVCGRNSINWDKRFEMNEWYVENVSLWLDIKIFFLTIKQVVVKKNIESTEGTSDSFAERKRAEVSK